MRASQNKKGTARGTMRKIRLNQKAFTLIEILIVISIIAILAVTIIPNFIGFDTDARVTATKSNLESIRTVINLYRAKEGKYPHSLGDLTTTFYVDLGVKKPYLNKIPPEVMSESHGSTAYVDQTAAEPLSGSGGWVYVTDTAEVKVNVTGSLGQRWGQYSQQEPAEW